MKLNTLGMIVNASVSVMTAKALGDLLQDSPALKQVGLIRTEYRESDGSVRGRSIEAVIMDSEANLFAVEQHRGVAIVAVIGDVEMRNAMLAEVASFDPASTSTFVYDQIITEGIEEIEPGKGLDMSEVTEVNHGTDGLESVCKES